MRAHFQNSRREYSISFERMSFHVRCNLLIVWTSQLLYRTHICITRLCLFANCLFERIRWRNMYGIEIFGMACAMNPWSVLIPGFMLIWYAHLLIPFTVSYVRARFLLFLRGAISLPHIPFIIAAVLFLFCQYFECQGSFLIIDCVYVQIPGSNKYCRFHSHITSNWQESIWLFDFYIFSFFYPRQGSIYSFVCVF